MIRTKPVQKKDSTMKIKITSVETRTSEKAGEYTVGKADVLKANGDVLPGKTFMAFGKPREATKGFLRAGRTVTVRAMFKNNTVMVLGQDPAKVKAKAEKAAAKAA